MGLVSVTAVWHAHSVNDARGSMRTWPSAMAALLTVALTAWAAPLSVVDAATTGRQEVQGGWIGAVPCLFTSVTPTRDIPPP